MAQVSAGLAARGVKPDDVLALCAPNSIGFVVTCLAAAAAGVTTTTVNPLWTETEVLSHLRQTHARWLVSTPDRLAGSLRAPVREAGLAGTLAIGGPGPAAMTFPAEPRTGSATVTPGSPAAAALLLSSSGTTGLPKIVVCPTAIWSRA